MKPMLAGKAEIDKLVYPVWASPKLDGIRCLVTSKGPVSRKLLPIPNKHICAEFAKWPWLLGYDGELVAGNFQATQSAVMSIEGTPDFTYWIFDRWSDPDIPFYNRIQVYEYSKMENLPPWVKVVSQTSVRNPEALRRFHDAVVKTGYEGTVVRDPNGRYKYGRSTQKEGLLLKLVDYATEEATVVNFEEQQHNDNPDIRDNLGRAKRSSAKAGKRGAGTLGALVVESERYPDVFRVGTGFTAAQRKEIWLHKRKYKGKLVTFKHKPSGALTLPRHPTFIGFRDPRDT